MGIYIYGEVMFGCVFPQQVFDDVVRKLIPNFDAMVDEDGLEEVYNSIFNGSINVTFSQYSDEWREEVYVYIEHKTVDLSSKNGDYKVVDKNFFSLSDKDTSEFFQQLTNLGFTDYTRSGWIVRTYLA